MKELRDLAKIRIKWLPAHLNKADSLTNVSNILSAAGLLMCRQARYTAIVEYIIRLKTAKPSARAEAGTTCL